MRKIIGLALAVLFLCSWQWAISDARLLRFPNINGDLVTFVYAGDIWSVPAAGGDARRHLEALTRHLEQNAPWGAKVTVTAAGRTQVAEHRSSGGYLSQNDLTVHFGFGSDEAQRIDCRPAPSGGSAGGGRGGFQLCPGPFDRPGRRLNRIF